MRYFVSRFIIYNSFIAAFTVSTIYSQTLVNDFELVKEFQFETTTEGHGGTDVWGWTADDGTEYALMAVLKGIAVVNAMTLEVDTVIAGPSIMNDINWLDIKTYKNYAYAVAGGGSENEGLMVIDLQFLPDSVKFIGSFPIDTSGSVRSHNLSIDTSTGFAYIVNNSTIPMSIFDLADPESPTFVHGFGDVTVHDIYVRNDSLYSGDFNGSFTIWDVSDKLNPVIMTRVDVLNASFIHNIWPTNDSRYVVTTEESTGKTVKIWDVSDYSNISMVGEWLGDNGVAHNVHIKDDIVFISHYTLGAYALDISDPTNPIEVGHFDTFKSSDGSDGLGIWGIYPYTNNGMVYVSDYEGKLTILRIRNVKVLEGAIDEVYVLPDTGKVNINVEDNGVYDSLKVVISESETALEETFALNFVPEAADPAHFEGVINPISGEHLYTVNLIATNSTWSGDDSGREDFFYDFAKFTTIGPVSYDSHEVLLYNGSIIFFELNLINLGISMTAPNVSVEISTADPCVTRINRGLSSFGDIAAGETAKSTDQYSFNFIQDCVEDEILIVDLAVSSDGIAFWSDNFEIQTEIVVNDTTAYAQLSEFKISPFDGAKFHQFGGSVSISGDYTVVGAQGDSDNGTNAGSAYVFKRSGAFWAEEAKLLPSDGAAFDEFGQSVSISGDYAVVGASRADGSAGTAYVFKRTGASWAEEAKLLASDGAENDRFGVSVSISGDYAVVGANSNVNNEDRTGSAYVFKRSGASWAQEAKLLASDGAAHDNFGFSVSISGDYIVVGANSNVNNEDRTGSAYVFKRSGTSWAQEAKLLAADGAAGDEFGFSVSISGDYAIVGAQWDDDNGSASGSAYEFKRDGTSWAQEAKLLASDGAENDRFGESVSISGDYAIVGARNDDDNGGSSGSAYVFKRTGTSWAEEEKLLASDGEAEDFFGESVSISGDFVVVGAVQDDDNGDDSGSAYMFGRFAALVGVESETANLPAEFSLSQNYPNPFNPETVINYALPVRSKVNLIIYNLLGQEVRRWDIQGQPAGNHRVSWDASSLASGVYLYRLTAGDFVQTKKMLLLK